MREVLRDGSILLALASLGAMAWLYTPDESRARLEAEYARPPSMFLDILELRLHVRDTGPRTAPAVVFLHGFGGSLQTWESWSRDLARDHRVVRYDLPGFGLTGADPTGDYSDARGTAVLLALMQRLGIGRASIVGHSMGGRIAWTFASEHLDRVDRLVLVSPDGFASPGLVYGVAPKMPAMMRALPYVMPPFLLRAAMAPAFVNERVLTPPLFRRYRDMMLAPGVRRAIVARMSQSVLVDPRPLLRRIAAPTLLLWGEQDAMIPFSNAADFSAALPNATLVALPGTGHIPQEEAPDAVDTLRSFLDGSAKAAPRLETTTSRFVQ